MKKLVTIVEIDTKNRKTAEEELAELLSNEWNYLTSTSTSDMGFVVLVKDVPNERPEPTPDDYDRPERIFGRPPNITYSHSQS